MVSRVWPIAGGSAVLVLVMLCTPGAADAQQRKPWRLTGALRVETQYDDNIFLLTQVRKQDLNAQDAGLLGNRYADMQHSNDLVSTASLSLGFRGPGLGGRTLTILPAVSMEYYARNGERQNVTVGLSLEQSLGNGGELRLRGETTPSYFPKNYLAAATDLDGNGSISPAERVYAPGTYRETEVSADYRLRLSKSRRRSPLGAALRVGGGYVDRRYESETLGRDRHGPTARAELLLDFGRRVGLDLGYRFEQLTATPTSQVLILDEPQFGRDLNGDGDQSDLDVRTTEVVDRSRREHRLGADLALGIGRRSDLTLEYEYRWRTYTSTEPGDVVYNGRTDARQVVGAELEIQLARRVRFLLGGEYARQRLNRASDIASIGEEDDYTRRRAFSGFAVNF